MKTPTTFSLLAISTITAAALVIPHDRGDWPASWPKELEPLRERSRTTEWATGSQEDSHQIPFSDRAEFEKLWPVFKSMLKPGATLNLRTTAKEASSVQDWTSPGVVIHCQADAVQIGDKPIGKPWPKSALLPDGNLPEYATQSEIDGELQWVPLTNTEKQKGFRFRARLDITLLCDGKVVDLNRIRLPDKVTVVDHRELP